MVPLLALETSPPPLTPPYTRTHCLHTTSTEHHRTPPAAAARLQDYICLRTFYTMDFPLRTLAFSHDSRYISLAGEQHALDVAAVETGQHLGRLQLRAM